MEIIGKYCRGARPRISSDRFLKGELFFVIFRILLENTKYCKGARPRISSDRFLKDELFFVNFWKLLENIVGVRDHKSLQIGSWTVNFFRKFLEVIVGCEMTNLFRQVLKGWIFFRKFLEIIGKYCWNARRRICSQTGS